MADMRGTGCAPFAAQIIAGRKMGRTWETIGQETGEHPEAVRAWFRRYKAQRPLESPARQRKKAVTSEDFADLAPIHLSPPPRPKKLVTSTKSTLVAGDFHFGPESYDPDNEEILLAVARDLRPQVVVLNGDLPDMLAVSKYPADVRIRIDLGEERRQMHKFLYRLKEITDVFGGKIVETNANHSGESHESRWWRYLSDRIPEVAKDPEFQSKLTYKAMWHPEWADIDIVDYHVICPGLIAIHGDIVRPKAAYSARGMLEKWRHNLVHGHTHRMGATAYRVPGIASKKEHQMRAYEGGCMCSLNPIYGSGTAADWQNGFIIFRHDDEGRFGAEQVFINPDKTAVVASLGQTYRSSE